MNNTLSKDNWVRFTEALKEKWGRHSANAPARIQVKQKKRPGRLQKDYVCAREKAQHELDEFSKSLK